MRVAGVRLADGRIVWVDAGDCHPVPLDRVIVHTPEGSFEGSVFVVPDQLIRDVEEVGGLMVEVRLTENPTETCDCLPGSDLPFLGSLATVKSVTGRMMALDPVGRTATIRSAEGAEIKVSLDEVIQS